MAAIPAAPARMQSAAFWRSLLRARTPGLVLPRDKHLQAKPVRSLEAETLQLHYRPRQTAIPSRTTFSNTGAKSMQSGDCRRAAITSSSVWQATLITGGREHGSSKMRRTSSADSASGRDGRCTPSASADNATSTLPFTRTLDAMSFAAYLTHRTNDRSCQFDLLARGKIFSRS